MQQPLVHLAVLELLEVDDVGEPRRAGRAGDEVPEERVGADEPPPLGEFGRRDRRGTPKRDVSVDVAPERHHRDAEHRGADVAVEERERLRHDVHAFGGRAGEIDDVGCEAAPHHARILLNRTEIALRDRTESAKRPDGGRGHGGGSATLTRAAGVSRVRPCRASRSAPPSSPRPPACSSRPLPARPRAPRARPSPPPTRRRRRRRMPRRAPTRTRRRASGAPSSSPTARRSAPSPSPGGWLARSTDSWSIRSPGLPAPTSTMRSGPT